MIIPSSLYIMVLDGARIAMGFSNSCNYRSSMKYFLYDNCDELKGSITMPLLSLQTPQQARTIRSVPIAPVPSYFKPLLIYS